MASRTKATVAGNVHDHVTGLLIRAPGPGENVPDPGGTVNGPGNENAVTGIEIVIVKETVQDVRDPVKRRSQPLMHQRTTLNATIMRIVTDRLTASGNEIATESAGKNIARVIEFLPSLWSRPFQSMLTKSFLN
ncbi:uncharacterized protein LOC129745286 [Uranotaenia lowii]|uniref:uncharacterized protein LOC129745286 n=1 Tax=Uranotaenia lowii TaxID=190385 RepID=UPI002479F759|nr:uncharacterized protein LOC129745286 [Uranotaenia lowii]